MTMGDIIKKLRIEKGMSQEELANKINTRKQTIHKYENDIVINIPFAKIQKLAEALNTTPQYLRGWIKNTPVINGMSLEQAIEILKIEKGLAELDISNGEGNSHIEDFVNALDVVFSFTADVLAAMKNGEGDK